MKAEPRLGLTLSWSRITAAFLIDVVVLLVARHFPGVSQTTGWWVGVAIAAVVTIAMVFAYRRMTLSSALARWLWDWSSDSAAALTQGCTPAIDHRRRFGRDVVGVREYQGQLVAVISVEERTDGPLGRHQRESPPPATLPVAVVGRALHQFDVHLDAIDIVSVQQRHSPEPDETNPEQTPAAIARRTWLILRMDPQQNVAAVAARDSVASTLAAAVERLAGDLDGRRCAARPLTADELAEVDTAVVAALRPESTRPGLRHLKHVDGYATSFWVSPWDITSETLDQLWLPDTDATVVTIRVAAADGWPVVSAWVCYHSRERMGKELWTGLNRLTGRQLAAVRASLAAPATRPVLVVPGRALQDDDQLAVRVVPMEADAAPMFSAEESEDAEQAAAPAV